MQACGLFRKDMKEERCVCSVLFRFELIFLYDISYNLLVHGERASRYSYCRFWACERRSISCASRWNPRSGNKIHVHERNRPKYLRDQEGELNVFLSNACITTYYHGKTEDNRVIGIIIVKTKLAILVAEYAPPHQAGEATPVVEGLADYLISTGY